MFPRSSWLIMFSRSQLWQTSTRVSWLNSWLLHGTRALFSLLFTNDSQQIWQVKCGWWDDFGSLQRIHDPFMLIIAFWGSIIRLETSGDFSRYKICSSVAVKNFWLVMVSSCCGGIVKNSYRFLGPMALKRCQTSRSDHTLATQWSSRMVTTKSTSW